MASHYQESVSASVTLVGSKEDGRGCLVTRNNFFWLIDIIHGSDSHSVGAHFIIETIGSCTSIEGSELEIKREEERVLTWRGVSAGDDPFSSDGETSIPTSGDSVVPRGTKRSYDNEIVTDGSSAADEGELVFLGFEKGKVPLWNMTCREVKNFRVVGSKHRYEF